LIGRLTLSFLLGGVSIAFGQAAPTAARPGDAQIGIGYNLGRPDYIPQNFQGVTAYADFDFRAHFGVEAEFHQINNTSGYQSFERTYEIGGRYLRTYGPLVPYVKAMVGRGYFEYPYGQTELDYNMFAVGVGADVKVGPYLRIRGEYELQKWASFPNGGLAPQIVTIGVAYHLSGRPR
jgi:Outer membrane protein beta-barrel domain